MSVSLDELNSVDDDLMMNFVEIIFICYNCERILIWQKNVTGFLENILEYYFLNIIVNVNFFSDLKCEYYCEYCPEILLQLSPK